MAFFGIRTRWIFSWKMLKTNEHFIIALNILITLIDQVAIKILTVNEHNELQLFTYENVYSKINSITDHKPSGGNVKIFSQKQSYDVTSRIGSLANANRTPGCFRSF